VVNNGDDPKTIAKEVLHNEIVEVINNFDAGKVEFSILYDMLRKLDKNWDEFIK
jgi:hypothetical protein